MEFALLAGVGFVAWLMWSNEDQKKQFLFYTWSAMLLCIIGQCIYGIYIWLTK